MTAAGAPVTFCLCVKMKWVWIRGGESWKDHICMRSQIELSGRSGWVGSSIHFYKLLCPWVCPTLPVCSLPPQRSTFLCLAKEEAWKWFGSKTRVLVNHYPHLPDSLMTHFSKQCFGAYCVPGMACALHKTPWGHTVCISPPGDKQSLLLHYSFMGWGMSFP